MTAVISLKQSICSLFEVHADDGGVHRVVTPLEYSGANDRIVIRVRPNGQGFKVDENGEAAFYAALNGGDIDSAVVQRWAEDLTNQSPAVFGKDEVISASASEQRLIAPYIFRVAEAAQQLYALATARPDRQANDFKDRIKLLVRELAEELNIPVQTDVILPIAGEMRADVVLGTEKPLIIIAATNTTRLLEAEVIHMQYRLEKKPGVVLAVAENQADVGRHQFERAAYFTDKTVIYNPGAFKQLLTQEISLQ